MVKATGQVGDAFSAAIQGPSLAPALLRAIHGAAPKASPTHPITRRCELAAKNCLFNSGQTPKSVKRFLIIQYVVKNLQEHPVRLTPVLGNANRG